MGTKTAGASQPPLLPLEAWAHRELGIEMEPPIPPDRDLWPTYGDLLVERANRQATLRRIGMWILGVVVVVGWLVVSSDQYRDETRLAASEMQGAR